MKSDVAAELLTAWNRNLYLWYARYNEEYVSNRLKRPIIEVGFGSQRLGSWDPVLRRIVISVEHIIRDPWLDVMDTLRHEMAHQYVHEIVDVDEAPHGSAFRDACEILRCDFHASARRTNDMRIPAVRDERLIRVLKKILSLATSPNEHEAQAAVNKARQLLLQYNVGLVELDSERHFNYVSVGLLKGRRANWELWVAMVLNEFFFVEVLWARSYDPKNDKMGTILQLFGTATNLAMASYVYDYLYNLLPRLWNEYQQVNDLVGNRERMRYYAGLMQGFYEKLKSEEENRKATVPTECTVGIESLQSTAGDVLVWQGDQRLRDYYHHMNPNVVERASSGVTNSEVFRDGVKEGRKVTIHRPLESGDGWGGLLSKKSS